VATIRALETLYEYINLTSTVVATGTEKIFLN